MFLRFALLLVTFYFVSCTNSINDEELLFNGKDLSGWHGDTSLWSVKDGAIYGSTLNKKLPANRFLIWEAEVADFELTYEAKIIGNNNSGMMYRAHKMAGDKRRMVGNQCDFHPKAINCGMLYSEGTRRGAVARSGQKVVVSAETGKPAITGKTSEVTEVDITQWTSFRIVAKGRHLKHYMNGKLVVDVIDNHKDASLKGLFGIQIHWGNPMEVYFRNITLKRR